MRVDGGSCHCWRWFNGININTEAIYRFPRAKTMIGGTVDIFSPDTKFLLLYTGKYWPRFYFCPFRPPLIVSG